MATSVLPPHGSRIASKAERAKILPHFNSACTRPSLYHDANAASSSSCPPLFTRKISWLPSPNILKFKPASLHPDSNDLALFTKWQNSPRVAAGWDQAWPEDKQRSYLNGIQSSSDALGLIGYWADGEDEDDEPGQPWGYIEIYWVKTSNLKPLYDFPDQALGFHALVGEDRFRGPDRVRAWMSSVVYMLFALDPRCSLVVSEPNIKNTKMVQYEEECGGEVEKVSTMCSSHRPL